VKICNQLVKKVKKFMVSQTGPRVVRSNSCKGPVYPGKESKRAKGPNENFRFSKCYLGPNFWNLSPKGPTWQPCVLVQKSRVPSNWGRHFGITCLVMRQRVLPVFKL